MGDGKRVKLIRPADRSEGQMTPGMRREQAVSTDRSWAGHVTTEAGMVSGWHHHGDYESHIYVVSGLLRMESGPGGQDVIDAQPGDFVFVPPHTVHTCSGIWYGHDAFSIARDSELRRPQSRQKYGTRTDATATLRASVRLSAACVRNESVTSTRVTDGT